MESSCNHSNRFIAHHAIEYVKRSLLFADGWHRNWEHTASHMSQRWARGIQNMAAVPDSETAAAPPSQQHNEHSRQPLSPDMAAVDSLAPAVPKRVKPGASEAEASGVVSQQREVNALHPAMDEMPLIERYMKLRADGHHVSEEEELLIIEEMLSRAAQVQEFESTGSLLPDAYEVTDIVHRLHCHDFRSDCFDG
jgi:hypothetical protein